MNILKAAQTDVSLTARGLLQINVVSNQNNFPVTDAVVSISSKASPNDIIQQVSVNSSGQTEQVSLPAPPLDYSFDPDAPTPYSEYVVSVEAPGFRPLTVSGTEVLPDSTAIQPIRLTPENQPAEPSQISIPDHTLVGNYPPKIAEAEVKPITETGEIVLSRVLTPENQPAEPSQISIPDHTLVGNYPPKIAEAEVKPITETGEIVLSRVVVPQTIVVHDGPPSSQNAPNYYVPYRDYIKNVASSEIYSTWPRATITANVLAIMSFTLNRVYTEWYRNQGYDFTITSSTAFDHKWIFDRNIFETISVVVDEIFDNYLSRPGVKQPILTQYCDGKQVRCPNWMAF